MKRGKNYYIVHIMSENGSNMIDLVHKQINKNENSEKNPGIDPVGAWPPHQRQQNPLINQSMFISRNNPKDFPSKNYLNRTTWWRCGVLIILPGFRKLFPCIFCFYLPPPVLVLYHLVVDRDRSLHIPWNYRCKR